MKTNIFFTIVMALLVGCADDIPPTPARIAVIYDLTSSANSSSTGLDTSLHKLLLPPAIKLLPKGSEVGYFNVSPDLATQPDPIFYFKEESDSKSAISKFKRGQRKMNRQKLKNVFSETYKRELESSNRSAPRSCIDNTILRAGNFLQTGPIDAQKILFIASDFLEQCNDSQLMNGKFYFWSTDNRTTTPLDSAQAALEHWNGDSPLSGTKVYYNILQQNIPFTSMGMSAKELEKYWEEVFTRWGATEVSEFTTSIPEDLGLIQIE